MVGKIIGCIKINRYDKRSLRNNNNINNRKYRNMSFTDKQIVDILYQAYPKVFNSIVDEIEKEEES